MYSLIAARSSSVNPVLFFPGDVGVVFLAGFMMLSFHPRVSMTFYVTWRNIKNRG
jgi:hypothetical protein